MVSCGYSTPTPWNTPRECSEESLARHAYSTEPVRRLLADPIPVNGHQFRPLGVLADFVEVAPGYEEPIEEFLKEALDYEVRRQAAILIQDHGATSDGLPWDEYCALSP